MMANPVDKLEICKNAARAGGLAVIDMPRNVKLETKADMYVGHHAVVGKADHASQEALLKVVMKDDPGAFFITEEHVENSDFRKHVIRSDNLMPLEENGAYIIDELDGTTSIEGVREAEKAFRAAGRTNLVVRAYPDADHDLNWTIEAASRGGPAPFQEAFDFVATLVGSQ